MAIYEQIRDNFVTNFYFLLWKVFKDNFIDILITKQWQLAITWMPFVWQTLMMCR